MKCNNNMFCYIFNEGSFKRKSDVADMSNICRQTPKSIAFNFASSTPTLVTVNKQQVATNSKYSNFNTCNIFITFSK